MDVPVASKIIVSFHQHSHGPYFWPHARSKQKVPSSVTEQHPKSNGEITQMVLLKSTFSLTDTILVFKMHKHFISGKFKQARAYVFSLPLSLCTAFIQGLSLNFVQTWVLKSWSHWFLRIKQFKVILSNNDSFFNKLGLEK